MIDNKKIIVTIQPNCHSITVTAPSIEALEKINSGILEREIKKEVRAINEKNKTGRELYNSVKKDLARPSSRISISNIIEEDESFAGEQITATLFDPSPLQNMQFDSKKDVYCKIKDLRNNDLVS